MPNVPITRFNVALTQGRIPLGLTIPVRAGGVGVQRYNLSQLLSNPTAIPTQVQTILPGLANLLNRHEIITQADVDELLGFQPTLDINNPVGADIGINPIRTNGDANSAIFSEMAYLLQDPQANRQELSVTADILRGVLSQTGVQGTVLSGTEREVERDQNLETSQTFVSFYMALHDNDQELIGRQAMITRMIEVCQSVRQNIQSLGTERTQSYLPQLDSNVRALESLLAQAQSGAEVNDAFLQQIEGVVGNLVSAASEIDQIDHPEDVEFAQERGTMTKTLHSISAQALSLAFLGLTAYISAQSGYTLMGRSLNMAAFAAFSFYMRGAFSFSGFIRERQAIRNEDIGSLPTRFKDLARGIMARRAFNSLHLLSIKNELRETVRTLPAGQEYIPVHRYIRMFCESIGEGTYDVRGKVELFRRIEAKRQILTREIMALNQRNGWGLTIETMRMMAFDLTIEGFDFPADHIILEEVQNFAPMYRAVQFARIAGDRHGGEHAADQALNQMFRQEFSYGHTFADGTQIPAEVADLLNRLADTGFLHLISGLNIRKVMSDTEFAETISRVISNYGANDATVMQYIPQIVDTALQHRERYLRAELTAIASRPNVLIDHDSIPAMVDKIIAQCKVENATSTLADRGKLLTAGHLRGEVSALNGQQVEDIISLINNLSDRFNVSRRVAREIVSQARNLPQTIDRLASASNREYEYSAETWLASSRVAQSIVRNPSQIQQNLTYMGVHQIIAGQIASMGANPLRSRPGNGNNYSAYEQRVLDLVRNQGYMVEEAEALAWDEWKRQQRERVREQILQLEFEGAVVSGLLDELHAQGMSIDVAFQVARSVIQRIRDGNERDIAFPASILRRWAKGKRLTARQQATLEAWRGNVVDAIQAEASNRLGQDITLSDDLRGLINTSLINNPFLGHILTLEQINMSLDVVEAKWDEVKEGQDALARGHLFTAHRELEAQQYVADQMFAEREDELIAWHQELRGNHAEENQIRQNIEQALMQHQFYGDPANQHLIPVVIENILWVLRSQFEKLATRNAPKAGSNHRYHWMIDMSAEKTAEQILNLFLGRPATTLEPRNIMARDQHGPLTKFDVEDPEAFARSFGAEFAKTAIMKILFGKKPEDNLTVEEKEVMGWLVKPKKPKDKILGAMLVKDGQFNEALFQRLFDIFAIADSDQRSAALTALAEELQGEPGAGDYLSVFGRVRTVLGSVEGARRAYNAMRVVQAGGSLPSIVGNQTLAPLVTNYVLNYANEYRLMDEMTDMCRQTSNENGANADIMDQYRTLSTRVGAAAKLIDNIERWATAENQPERNRLEIIIATAWRDYVTQYAGVDTHIPPGVIHFMDLFARMGNLNPQEQAVIDQINSSRQAPEFLLVEHQRAYHLLDGIVSEAYQSHQLDSQQSERQFAWQMVESAKNQTGYAEFSDQMRTQGTVNATVNMLHVETGQTQLRGFTGNTAQNQLFIDTVRTIRGDQNPAQRMNPADPRYDGRALEHHQSIIFFDPLSFEEVEGTKAAQDGRDIGIFADENAMHLTMLTLEDLGRQDFGIPNRMAQELDFSFFREIKWIPPFVHTNRRSFGLFRLRRAVARRVMRFRGNPAEQDVYSVVFRAVNRYLRPANQQRAELLARNITERVVRRFAENPEASNRALRQIISQTVEDAVGRIESQDFSDVDLLDRRLELIASESLRSLLEFRYENGQVVRSAAQAVDMLIDSWRPGLDPSVMQRVQANRGILLEAAREIFIRTHATDYMGVVSCLFKYGDAHAAQASLPARARGYYDRATELLRRVQGTNFGNGAGSGNNPGGRDRRRVLRELRREVSATSNLSRRERSEINDVLDTFYRKMRLDDRTGRNLETEFNDELRVQEDQSLIKLKNLIGGDQSARAMRADATVAHVRAVLPQLRNQALTIPRENSNGSLNVRINALVAQHTNAIDAAVRDQVHRVLFEHVLAVMNIRDDFQFRFEWDQIYTGKSAWWNYPLTWQPQTKWDEAKQLAGVRFQVLREHFILRPDQEYGAEEIAAFHLTQEDIPHYRTEFGRRKELAVRVVKSARVIDGMITEGAIDPARHSYAEMKEAVETRLGQMESQDTAVPATEVSAWSQEEVPEQTKNILSWATVGKVLGMFLKPLNITYEYEVDKDNFVFRRAIKRSFRFWKMRYEGVMKEWKAILQTQQFYFGGGTSSQIRGQIGSALIFMYQMGPVLGRRAMSLIMGCFINKGIDRVAKGSFFNRLPQLRNRGDSMIEEYFDLRTDQVNKNLAGDNFKSDFYHMKMLFGAGALFTLMGLGGGLSLFGLPVTTLLAGVSLIAGIGAGVANKSWGRGLRVAMATATLSAFTLPLAFGAAMFGPAVLSSITGTALSLGAAGGLSTSLGVGAAAGIGGALFGLSVMGLNKKLRSSRDDVRSTLSARALRSLPGRVARRGAYGFAPMVEAAMLSYLFTSAVPGLNALVLTMTGVFAAGIYGSIIFSRTNTGRNLVNRLTNENVARANRANNPRTGDVIGTPFFIKMLIRNEEYMPLFRHTMAIAGLASLALGGWPLAMVFMAGTFFGPNLRYATHNLGLPFLKMDSFGKEKLARVVASDRHSELGFGELSRGNRIFNNMIVDTAVGVAARVASVIPVLRGGVASWLRENQFMSFMWKGMFNSPPEKDSEDLCHTLIEKQAGDAIIFDTEINGLAGGVNQQDAKHRQMTRWDGGSQMEWLFNLYKFSRHSQVMSDAHWDRMETMNIGSALVMPQRAMNLGIYSLMMANLMFFKFGVDPETSKRLLGLFIGASLANYANFMELVKRSMTEKGVPRSHIDQGLNQIHSYELVRYEAFYKRALTLELAPFNSTGGPEVPTAMSPRHAILRSLRSQERLYKLSIAMGLPYVVDMIAKTGMADAGFVLAGLPVWLVMQIYRSKHAERITKDGILDSATYPNADANFPLEIAQFMLDHRFMGRNLYDQMGNYGDLGGVRGIVHEWQGTARNWGPEDGILGRLGLPVGSEQLILENGRAEARALDVAREMLRRNPAQGPDGSRPGNKARSVKEAPFRGSAYFSQRSIEPEEEGDQ